MKLQHIVVGLAAALLLTGSALAQNGGGFRHGGGGGGRGGMRMLQQLNLTADQQAKLQPIMDKQRARRDQMRSQMEAILTPEQKAQMGNHMGRGAMRDLNLTPDQQSKMQQLRQSMRADMQADRQAMQAILTPDQLNQLKQMRQQRGGGRHGGGRRGGGVQNGSTPSTGQPNGPGGPSDDEMGDE